MRIRRAASRVLCSAAGLSAKGEAPPRPPPASELPPPPSALAAAYGADDVGPGSHVAGPEGVCELSLSPWDLPCELHEGDSSPQNLQDVPFDKYLVHIPRRASFVFNSEEDDDTMEMEDKIWNHEHEVVKNQKPAADNLKKDGTERKRRRKGNDDEPMLQEEEDMVMKTGGSEDKKDDTWFCKKNDGKKWHCRSIVDGPNTMCDYHLARSRSYYTPGNVKVEGASATAAATSSSSTKASATGKPTPAKSSSSKRTPAGAASSSSKEAPAIAPNSSKKASSSVTVPTRSISQRCKRKQSTDGGSGGDFYFYDLFGPFRGKDRSGSTNRRVVSAGAGEKGLLLQQDNAVVLEANEKMEYIDVDNLSNNSSITGGDKENYEDYFVGGAGKAARAEKGKGKIAVEKKTQFPKMVKKCVKERSLKSLL